MGKIVLAIILGLLLYLLLRSRRGAPPSAKPATPTMDMVRCARCGVHLPANEGLTDGGRHYCCEEHRRLDRA